MSGTWAVFLDRDGTLNEDVGLLSRPDQLRLLPGAAGALRRLRSAGARLLVVTNQTVVARGMVDEDGLKGIHRRLEDLLAAEGASVDAILYCPHHPETHHPEARDPRYRRDCPCRKPKPGMILEAAGRFGVDLKASFLIGDHRRDIEAAHAAGLRAVLLRGPGTRGAELDGVVPEAVAASMGEAADWILRNR